MRHVLSSRFDVEFFRHSVPRISVSCWYTVKQEIAQVGGHVYAFRSIDLKAPICCAHLPKAKPRFGNRRNLTLIEHDIEKRTRVAS